jgi:AcrR family transcriptional regulator
VESILRPVKPRAYDASRRREQATRTRRAIVDAARRRFLEDGFATTTIASIASDAQASPDTIYKSFRGKAGILRAICEDALAGIGPVPAEQRSDAMQAAETDPARMLRGLGTLTAEVAPRIAPLLLLLAAAGETDRDVASLRDELDEARMARMTHVARVLTGKKGLRADVTVERAADVLWTYSSPELYRLLVVNRGWSPDSYGRFIGEALVHTLLDTPTSETAPPASRATGAVAAGDSPRPESVQPVARS